MKLLKIIKNYKESVYDSFASIAIHYFTSSISMTFSDALIFTAKGNKFPSATG